MWLVKSLLIISCIAIFVFDIKYRAVYWWLYVLVFGMSLYIALQHTSFSVWKIHTAINLLVITVQFVVLQIWYIIRVRRFEFMFRKAIGLGDVLFLLCPVVLLPVPLFLYFLVIGFILSLLAHGIALRMFANYSKTVPLAGYLSIVYALVIIANMFHVLSISYAAL